MDDLSQIDQEQLQQLLEQGHTPEEAAQILLESRRTMADACQRLLDGLRTTEGLEACRKLLEELGDDKN